MRIAQVAPLWENIPPIGYGGTERIVSAVTEGLVAAGHDVTLFACGTSTTKAKLISVYPRPLFRDGIPWTSIMYPLLNITEAFDREREFDILHVHLNKPSDYITLPLARYIPKKVVFTLHFPYPTTQPHREDRHAVLSKYKDLQYISISQSQRRGGEHMNWITTVYNAINIANYSFNPEPKNELFWLGKFNPDKGTKNAILAAKLVGKPIQIAGTVDKLEGEDKQYYEEEVKPLLDNENAIFIGELDRNKKNEAYGNAKVFVNPIQWNEPFGLVMAEAMASGTPVVGFANGAAPEIIKDGVTGFLVNQDEQNKHGDFIIKKTGIEGLAEGIERIYAMRPDEYLMMRRAARKHIEDNFTNERMVKDYEKVYQDVLTSSG